MSAPAGAQPAGDAALGAQLALTGRNITIDGTVGLPSGKLQLTASGDVTLGAESRIDLAGRAVKFFEQTRYSRGGDLEVTSTAGNIAQAAGSVIDLSATHNRGGSLQATALGTGAGRIDLGGRILGTASGTYDAGGTVVPYDAAEISVRGQTVADFAGLNTRLNEGGVTGARRFQIKQGDLAIGDEVKARVVEVTLDGGSLTVNGRIDASGFQVGAIRLAAKGDLTVNGTLDAHATGLRVDSYGKIIDSPNRAIVDLTSTHGTLTLGGGAAIDLRAGTAVSAAQGNDGIARGTLALNAPRRGDNDVAVNVAGTPAIQGAKSIAVNAFRTYSDAPLASAPDVTGHVPQLITQKYLDEIDGHSSAFIDKALANTSLSARLAGLGSYHLRPGVEIVSSTGEGDLSVVGDIDLSGYRYGPGANRTDPARRGFGEPGVLVIRAGGNLNVYGSINDGFRAAAGHARRQGLVPHRAAHEVRHAVHARRRRHRRADRRRGARQGHRVPEGRAAELRRARRSHGAAGRHGAARDRDLGRGLHAARRHGAACQRLQRRRQRAPEGRHGAGRGRGAGQRHEAGRGHRAARRGQRAGDGVAQGRAPAGRDEGRRHHRAGARCGDSVADRCAAAERRGREPAARSRRRAGPQLGRGADAGAGRDELEPAAHGRRRPGLGRPPRGRSGQARRAHPGRQPRDVQRQAHAGR